MAISVSVTKDLSGIKTKVALNLTKRQLICFGGAAAVGIPFYIFTKDVIGTQAAALIMVAIMLPFFFLAMYEKHGQPLEVFLKHFIQANFVRPKTRPYKTDNYYAALIRQAKAEEEVEKIVRISEEREKERVRDAKASD